MSACVFDLQGGDEALVLLSTRCPDTKLYTITLPCAQMREREDSGLAAARALIEAGVKSSSVVRNGAYQPTQRLTDVGAV